GTTANGASLPRGNLLTYALARTNLPAPSVIPSRIFNNGGAWLFENSTSPNALTGALWNVKGSEYHSHKDVNSLHLTAYGEHVLRNVGYKGAGDASNGFS